MWKSPLAWQATAVTPNSFVSGKTRCFLIEDWLKYFEQDAYWDRVRLKYCEINKMSKRRYPQWSAVTWIKMPTWYFTGAYDFHQFGDNGGGDWLIAPCSGSPSARAGIQEKVTLTYSNSLVHAEVEGKSQFCETLLWSL